MRSGGELHYPQTGKKDVPNHEKKPRAGHFTSLEEIRLRGFSSFFIYDNLLRVNRIVRTLQYQGIIYKKIWTGKMNHARVFPRFSGFSTFPRGIREKYNIV
jgi:hypothetical protein